MPQLVSPAEQNDVVVSLDTILYYLNNQSVKYNTGDGHISLAIKVSYITLEIDTIL